MALTHNSTLADKEPAWSSVDKTKLPRNAYADMGDPDKKSSWRYPHHWVKDGKTGGKHGIFISGTMYLHKGGLRSALQAAGGARSGKKESNSSVKAHLARHSKAIGMSDKEAAGLLSIPEGEIKLLLETKTVKTRGGEQKMDLEARIKELEKQLKEKEIEIQEINSDKAIQEFQGKISDLESKNADFEAKIEVLETEIVQLKKDKEDLTSLSSIGKKAIDELKNDIKKLSVAVRGNDYNEGFVDKQLEAFENDYEYLAAMKTDLENQQAKLFKKGDLDLDVKKTEIDKKNEEIEIGRNIGRANLSIVSSKK